MFLKILMLIGQTAAEKRRTCYYWYVLDKGLRFQWSAFDHCYDRFVFTFGINSITNSNIHDVDYHCFIFGIPKNNAIKLLKIVIWVKKMDHFEI